MATKKPTINKASKGAVTVSSSGLKSRAATPAPAVRAIRKPNKMKLLKPRRLSDKTVDFSNSAMLVFPTDIHGITAGIKTEMKRASSRVTSPKDLQVLKDTVVILMKHVEHNYTNRKETPVLKRRSDSITEANIATAAAIVEAELQAASNKEANIATGKGGK